MSLAFLAKKSWHTANLRNVEKVWIAEQKHAAEEKKVAELRKNIEEERQLQELRQLQAAQGNKAAATERVDWMYEGPSAAREKTAEEFLLGKEYKGEDEKAAKGDVDLSTTTKYGSLALSKATLPANDAFQRLNEDPMMLIRKRQQAAREQVLKNPVKMNRIKAKVDSLLEDKKARKKAKKAAKKEKKHARREEKRRLKKKRKHSIDGSDDSGASEDEEKDSHRYRDHHSKRHRGDHRRSPLRSQSRSRSPLTERHGRGRRHTERDLERSPINHRSDRASPRRHPMDRHHRDRSSSKGRGRASPQRRRSDGHGRMRSNSRGRRSSSLTREHRYRNRSRSPHRDTSCAQRDRSRSRSPQGRDAFGRDRPASRSARHSIDRRSRTPPRRERRSDESRLEKDRQSKRRSRSPNDSYRAQHNRSSPRGERKHHERSTRRHSSSRDRESKSAKPPSDSQRHHETKSRHKPIDADGKYGLISKAGAVESKDVDKTSLGPNAKYLAKAREAKRLEEEECQRKLGKSSRAKSRELTDEEKKRMAEQMVEDARQREEYIAKRATLKKEELDKREKEVTDNNPEFLRKLHSEAYLDGESNMGDRLRRNKHYIQRNADSANFLSK